MFFFSSRRRHTRCALVTGVQTCALPIYGHFLRPGRPEVPIAFRVERDRDGASFSSRRVAAYQEEVLVFTLGASFHPAEAGFAHQEDMPDVAPPEHLRSEEDIRREQAGAMIGARSEEHTSELQSLMRNSYAVF